MGPEGGGSQKYDISTSAPDGVPNSAAEFVTVDTSYEISEEVERFEVKPEWIDSIGNNFIENIKEKVLFSK